jgi:hypothetical protein
METAVRIAAKTRRNIHQQGENEPDTATPAYGFDQRVAW